MMRFVLCMLVHGAGNRHHQSASTSLRDTDRVCSCHSVFCFLKFPRLFEFLLCVLLCATARCFAQCSSKFKTLLEPRQDLPWTLLQQVQAPCLVVHQCNNPVINNRSA